MTDTTAEPFGRRQRAAAIGVLVVACAIAGWTGTRATHDLRWAPGDDFSRDVANAETLSTGSFPFADPVYRGEIDWYNPLVPGFTALTAVVLRQPIPVVSVRLGAYVNLLAPITFFWLMWRFFGPATAAAGVVAFLFLIPGDYPAILSATYSPWLLPIHAVQAIFYVALAAIARAWHTREIRGFFRAGVLAGVTFLGHTAPFLILAMVVLFDAAGRFRSAPARTIRNAAMFYVAAAAVSAVFWGPLLWKYHFVVRNPAPMFWDPPELAFDRLWRVLLSAFVVTPIPAVATIGVAQLIRNRTMDGYRLLGLTGVASVIGVLYGYLMEFIKQQGIVPPSIVPTFHFLYYLGFVAAAAFGVGVVAVTRLASRASSRYLPIASARRLAPAIVATTVALLAAGRVSAYSRREDFVGERSLAEQMFADPAERGLYNWVRANTQRTDVILIDESTGLSIVGAAGRKAVVVHDAFSNPYVDWAARSDDRQRMQDALDRADCATFSSIAQRYDVTWVARFDPYPDSATLRACLSRAVTFGRWSVYHALIPR